MCVQHACLPEMMPHLTVSMLSGDALYIQEDTILLFQKFGHAYMAMRSALSIFIEQLQ